jgi:hypothetical protein
MRRYAALYDNYEQEAAVIFQDEGEEEWYFFARFKSFDDAKRVANAMNK